MRGTWTGTGPPVVLLHGQPGSGRAWRLVKSELDGLNVLAPDRPGYDGTPAEDFAGNAKRLSAVLTDASVGPVVLVGHSWGGGVALQLALDHPDQVAGLCLIGSIGSPLSWTRLDTVLSWPGLAGVAATITCCTAVAAPRAFVAATGSVLPAGERHELRKQGLRWLRGAVPAVCAEQRFLVRQGPRLAERLGEIRSPALVVAGRSDRTVTPNAATELARALPRGRLLMVKGGHLLLQEAPATVAAAIWRCIRDVKP